MEDLKLEKYKAELQMWIEQYKSGIESGKNAIRMAFLINSGTSLALLTFIGTIFNHVAIALNKSKTGLWLEILTIVLVASSYGLFLFGGYEIYKIIITQL
jgi:hypothetical protein